MEKIHTLRLPQRNNPWWKPYPNLRLERAKILSFWRNIRADLLLGLAFSLFLALVQFSSPDLPDNDGYYHIKMAYLMRSEGLKPDFPWLPLSILNQREFYNHHFLFHVALIPFTFGDLRLGAKIAAVVFASLAFWSVWRVFKNQRLPYAGLWALGLMAVSEAFIYRMSIPRAQSLSLLVLMVGLDWLLRKKFSYLAPLAFVYVWLYNAFPLLLVFSFVYVGASWVVERRLDLRPIVYTALGIAAGLLINPYFPHNIVFAGLHILPKLTETTAVQVGNEWYPYNTTQLLQNSPLALLAFASGALALGLSGKRMDLRTFFAFCLACLFGLMLFQSRRFIEYFPPFALVFAAFAWTPVWQQQHHPRQDKPATPTGRLASWISRASRSGGWVDGIRQRLPALALILALVPGMWVTLQAAQASLQRSKPYSTFAGASAWLQANTPYQARVFQTDWDDFPRLFYYNSHNTYLIGLDPTYMQLYDAELYEVWVEVTQGKVERPSGVIRQVFGAGYVVSDLRHTRFLERAENDPGLVEVYRDGDAVVFRVAGDGEALSTGG